MHRVLQYTSNGNVRKLGWIHSIKHLHIQTTPAACKPALTVTNSNINA